MVPEQIVEQFWFAAEAVSLASKWILRWYILMDQQWIHCENSST